MSSRSTADQSGEVKRELEDAKGEAAEMTQAAREGGRRQFDEVKHRAADRAEDAADAMEAAADEMDARDEDAISGYGRSLASITRQLAGGLRERDIDQFAGELAGFARRNPAAFLASSVALGFGVARFLRAGSDHDGHGRSMMSGGRDGGYERDDYEEEEYERAVTPGWTPEHAMTQPTTGGNRYVVGDSRTEPYAGQPAKAEAPPSDLQSQPPGTEYPGSPVSGSAAGEEGDSNSGESDYGNERI